MLIHNADITGSLTINGVPYNTGSFTGSFYGDGSQLSGVTSYTNADTLAFIQGYSGSYSGSFSGSFFGDGSNLSGVTSYTDADTLDFINSLNVVSGSIQTVSTVSDTFTSATSYTVTHNFGTKEVIVSVYENDTLIFPSSITTPTVNTVTITFPEPVTGRVVVVKAGHIVSGSINYNSVLNKPTLVSGSSQISFTGITNKPTLVSGSSQITYSGLTGIPSGIVSGSSQISFTGITNKPTLVSGSSQIAQFGYATTGSNIFQGNQTITGSLFIAQNLVVAGSSSIQYISSSVLDIANNIITVNVLNPSVRFGGLAVIDSGSSPQRSGSMLFDSIKDEWIFVHQNQSTITSSVVLMGPETYNNLGNETYLSANRLPKGSGVEHLRDSNITDTGTVVSVNSNTQVTGSFTVTTGSAVELQVTNLGVNIGSALTDLHVISGSLRVNPNGLFVSGSGNVGISTILPSERFEVNTGQGARAGMALTGEYPYLRFNVSSSSANARNWAFNATNAEPGDFALLQSTAKDGNPVTAGTSILGFGRNGAATFSSSVTATSLILNGSDNTIITQIKGASGMLQVYPYLTAADGPIIQALDLAAANFKNLRIECIATTIKAPNSVVTDGSAANINLHTTTAYGANIGGTIGLGGLFNGSASTEFVVIAGKKENATINNLAGYLAFYTRGALTDPIERMRITSAGNVSIGNTNNTYKLDVTGQIKSTQYLIAPDGTNNVYHLVDATSTYAGLYTIQAGGGSSGFGGSISMYGHSHATKPGYVNIGISASSNGKFTVTDQANASGTEIFVVQQNGNVGIGTASPTARLQVSNGTLGLNLPAHVVNITGNNYTGATIGIYDAASLAANTGGGINFGAFYTSTQFTEFAYIRTNKDTATSGEYGGSLIFATRPNGGSLTERMRITSDNNVLFNTTSSGTTNTSSFIFRSGTGAYSGVMVINHATTNNTGAGFIDCYYNTGYIGGIQQNGTSNVSFTTASDYRLKQDLKDFNGLNLISNLKVYDFKWKIDDSRMHGVIAHELQEVIPYAVHGNKDEIKENGKIKVQVVDYSKLVPVLVKAIQELKAENDTLKSRIDTLEQA